MKDKDTNILEEMYAKRFTEAIRPNGNRTGQPVSPTDATTNPNAGNVTTATTGPADPTKPTVPEQPPAVDPNTGAPVAAAPAPEAAPAVDPNTGAPVTPQPGVDNDPNSNVNQMIVAAEEDPTLIDAFSQQGFKNPMTQQDATPEEIQQFVQYYQQNPQQGAMR